MPISHDNPALAHEPQAALHGRLLNVSRMATIGEMAAGVAHELNQPLTAIANYAHACDRLLGSREADREDIREALRQITSQTKRAADILRRLRTLVRNQPSERARVQPNVLVEELFGLLTSDASLHGARLEVSLTPGLPEVRVDAAQIQQVILNLVRNGVEALAMSGCCDPMIVIRTSLSAGQVEIAVIDNGPGLARDAQRRLFDPFFSTKDNGTGLGLAMSNTIARAHGGSVSHRPCTPGACFSLHLPPAGDD